MTQSQVMYHHCGQSFYQREGTDANGNPLKYMDTPYGEPAQRVSFGQSCPRCLIRVSVVISPAFYASELEAGRAGPRTTNEKTLF